MKKYTAVANFKKKHVNDFTVPNRANVRMIKLQGQTITITEDQKGWFDYRSIGSRKGLDWGWKKKWLKDIKPIKEEKKLPSEVFEKFEEGSPFSSDNPKPKTIRKWLWCLNGSTISSKFYTEEEALYYSGFSEWEKSNCYVDVEE
jgi:hypothetical protein